MDRSRGALTADGSWHERRPCGASVAVMRSTFRLGDLVYYPPADRSEQPGVAVVVKVCYFGSAADRVPTGEIDLLMWDVAELSFSRVLPKVHGNEWTLLPACCGRGAACPQLQLLMPLDCHWPRPPAPKECHWHSSELLDRRVLEPIPAAFYVCFQRGLSDSAVRAAAQSLPPHIRTAFPA
jgi:hypothetical protein